MLSQWLPVYMMLAEGRERHKPLKAVRLFSWYCNSDLQIYFYDYFYHLCFTYHQVGVVVLLHETL